MSRFVIACAAALAFVPFLPGQGKQTPEQKALVKRIFDLWKERRAQYKTVRYKAKGETFHAKGMIPWLGQGGKNVWLPKEDLRLPCHVNILLDFAGGRHRLEQEKSDPLLGVEENIVIQRREVAGFNGKEMVSTISLGLPPSMDRIPFDAFIKPRNFVEREFSIGEWPPFIAHGMIPAWTAKADLKKPYEGPHPLETYVHGTAKHRGRECVVLRTEPSLTMMQGVSEYWVDMAEGGAVLRYAAYRMNGAEHVHDIDLRYGQENGRPLASWTYTTLSAGKTKSVQEMTVVEHELGREVDDETFRVGLSPGMRVNRTLSTGKEEELVVALDGSLQPVNPPAGGGRWFWWLVSAAVFAALAGVVWLFFRQKAA